MWSKKVNEEEGVASMAQFEKFFIQIKEKYRFKIDMSQED